MNAASRVRWRILTLLVLASFVSYNLRYSLSLAPEEIMRDLGLTEIQWGWVAAAFPLGYAILQFPGGLAADRFGPRRVLTIIAIAWGVLLMVTAQVPGPALVSTAVTLGLLIGVQLLVGLAHAPVFPTVSCVIQRWFPVGHWGFPNGLTSTGLTWGAAAITPVLAALIGAYGWRVAFMIVAPLAFLVAAIWAWYSRDFPAMHSSVNSAERALIEAGRDEERAVEEQPGNWLRVLKNRDLLALTFSYSCMNYGFYSVFSWFFYYLKSIADVGESLSVTVVSSQWIAGGIAAALGGWAVDRACCAFGFRWGCRATVMVSMVASGLVLIGGLLTQNVTLAAGLFVAFFFFNQFTEGPYWAAAMALGRRMSGTAGGVMNTGANVMGAVMSVATPLLAERFGWTVAMGTAGGFAFLAAASMMGVRADRPVRFD